MPSKVFIRSRHPSHDTLRENRIRTRKRTVYRMGSETEGNYHNEINSVQGVQNCSDKKLMKECFDAAEITHPEWSTSPLDCFPQIRKVRNSSRGQGLTKIDSESELGSSRSDVIYEKFHNYAREYRYNVSPLGVFYVARKLRRDGEEPRWMFNNETCIWVTEKKPRFNSNDKFIGWGEANSNFCKLECHEEIESQCMDALQALEMDIAAFDVKVKSNGREFMIIEANSAPSMGRVSNSLYQKELAKLVREFQF